VGNKTETKLVEFNKARVALANATRIDEVKNIRDKAEALRAYAKQSGESLEMQNQCSEIKIRAERRAGEILGEQEKNEGGRPIKNPSHDVRSFQPSKYSDLGIKYKQASRWQKIAEIPEEVFEKHIVETKSKSKKDGKTELTSTNVLKLSKNIERNQKIEELKAVEPVLAEGPFNVIVIDPPWKYTNRTDDPSHRAANPYPDMTVEEIKALPVSEKATDDCVLWLWTTNAFLHDAFHVVETWGFKYKTLLTWEKDKLGLGDWLRGKTEHCLMCVKGRPIVNLTNQTTIIHGPLREHSRKPDEFYNMIITLCPGNRADWFGREIHKGFITIGNEPEKFREK